MINRKGNISVKRKEKKYYVINVTNNLRELTRYFRSHLKLQHGEKKFKCEICPQAYATKKYLLQHMESHEGKNYACGICGKTFKNKRHMRTHFKICESKTGEKY